MKLDTYFKLREQFISQYENSVKNDFGYVYLKDFEIRSFNKFIFIFSHDLVSCSFTNTVSSISPIKFMVKQRMYADKIRLNGHKSILDKYPEQFEKIKNYYKKICKD